MQVATQIVPFMFEAASVRTAVDANGQPWFVAADVCSALDIQNPTQAIARLDADEKAMLNIGPFSDANIVSESGMYTLVLRCRDALTPGTRPYRFRKWVTADVLPSIRKTGSYSATPALSRLEILQLAIDSEQRALAAESLLLEQAPKADFYDKYTKAAGNKGIREVAKLLHANEREFAAFLVAQNYMYRLGGRLMPFAYHHHAGRFEVKVGVSNNDHAFNQAMFTTKGISWIAAEWAKYQLIEV